MKAVSKLFQWAQNEGESPGGLISLVLSGLRSLGGNTVMEIPPTLLKCGEPE